MVLGMYGKVWREQIWTERKAKANVMRRKEDNDVALIQKC